jgi:Na+/H+ antiporter NhaC
MKFIEPTPKTRQLFFLSLFFLGVLALAIPHIDDLLPPLSSNQTIVFEQVLSRSLMAAVLSTLFFVVFSGIAFHYTQRAIRSGQWPPKGMSVPFRIKITEIKNPRNAWALLIILLCLFLAQTAMIWIVYVKQRAHFEELKQLIEITPNKAPQPTPKSGAAEL